MVSLDSLLDSGIPELFDIDTVGEGPTGQLPLTEELLRESPSGDLFGMTQSAGMGWDPQSLLRDQILILSTQGGIRAEDGSPIALGYHTGHWEVGLLMRAAARELKDLERIPFAAYCSDPCDGRSQGTTAMMDSLPYRNDAAIVLKRLIRSLPLRRGVIGVATCDKGLPAMMMALASVGELPSIIVPGGVTLPARESEDAGKVQSIGARFSHAEITLKYAADMGCRACGSAGGGCQFLGTASTSQVVGEALGMSLPHSALAPSGQPIWADIATRSARAIVAMQDAKIGTRDIVTDDAMHNAMVVHAACGGSTNLLLHIPAIAFAQADRRGLEQDQSASSSSSRCPAEWAGRTSNHSNVLGRWSSRADASFADFGTAQVGRDDCQWSNRGRCAGVVGKIGAAKSRPWAIGSTRRSRSRKRHHVCRASSKTRLDQHGLFSDRQPRAGRIGDQEHGD